MTENRSAIHPDLLQQVINILQDRFATEIRIASVLFLSEPERRNVVLRILLENTSDSVPKSIILKQSLPELFDTGGR